MPFQKGNRGRPVGAKGRRTLEFQQTLEENDFNPAAALLEIYDVARECFEYGNREEKPIYLRMILDTAKEIASYSYPKLKSIEQKKVSALDGMTPEEKLEAMRKAVALLEGEIKKNEVSKSKE